jgi:hypothetical protein
MLASLQGTLPDQWRETLNFLASGFTWIIDWQNTAFTFAVTGSTGAEIVAKVVFLLLPIALLVASMWCTMASLYTLPFRSGRGGFLTALLLSWWDAGRTIWFFWAGIVRFGVVFVGWIWGLVKLAGSLLLRFIKFLFTRPFALLDWASRSYFQPGVPWLAFLFILLWSALEATVFTFTLRPLLTEVLAGITGRELNEVVLMLILWPMLFILISGSFAGIQAMIDAVNSKQVPRIIGTGIFETSIMMFEVVFLYRELVDAITPWIAQETGVRLGFGATLAIASFGWIGVRSMTWFLFGRFGTPALLGILARHKMEGTGGPAIVTPIEADFWRGPIAALKAESEWFKKEAREVFELLSLPVLQILAAGVNFAVIVILSRPIFTLPFRTLDQVLANTPFLSAASHKASAAGMAA